VLGHAKVCERNALLKEVISMTEHPLVSLTDQEIFNEAYYGRYRENQEPYVEYGYYYYEGVYYLDEVYRDSSPEPILDAVCRGHEAPSAWLSPEVDRFWEMIKIDPETVSPERKKFLTMLRLTDTEDTEDDPLEPLNQFAQDLGLQIPSDLD
jgi:hypothetical protein